MMSIEAAFIPDQYTGLSTETTSSVEAVDRAAAILLFKKAKERLMEINKWQEWSGTLSSCFQLFNSNGQPVNDKPDIGMYIRIDIPGPGTAAGKGYDWVVIQKINDVIVSPEEEFLVITARPAAAPGEESQETAHFLTEEATSSFVVSRNGLLVSATVYGRNELPNTDNTGTFDTIRNAIVGSSGAVGVSKLQWKALTEGLLDAEPA